MLRASLFEAGLVLLTNPRIRWSPLKAWGMAVVKRRGMQKAVVAVARKLAIVLHRMWRDEADFRWPGPPDPRRHGTAEVRGSSRAGGRGPCGDDGDGRDRGNFSGGGTADRAAQMVPPILSAPSMAAAAAPTPERSESSAGSFIRRGRQQPMRSCAMRPE